MPIVSTDVKYFYSGGAANSNPNASLGGVKSSVEWPGGTINDLWDNISGPENAESDVEYRLVYVQNNHATLTLQTARVFVQSQVAGGADIAIALADEGVSATAETIADEDTAPVGPVFSTPTTYAGGLSLGNLAPGAYYGIWIRRTAANTAAVSSDGATIRTQGDTAA